MIYTLVVTFSLAGPLGSGGDFQRQNTHEHMVSFRECFERASQWQAKAEKLPPGSFLSVTCEAKSR